MGGPSTFGNVQSCGKRGGRTDSLDSPDRVKPPGTERCPAPQEPRDCRAAGTPSLCDASETAHVAGTASGCAHGRRPGCCVGDSHVLR